METEAEECFTKSNIQYSIRILVPRSVRESVQLTIRVLQSVPSIELTLRGLEGLFSSCSSGKF
jgi:hypothetical protein